MAFLWDLVARGLTAHPAPPPPPGPALPAGLSDLPAGRALSGLVALEKVAFAARQAFAAKGLDLESDVTLGLDVLDAAAALIPNPQVEALDEAAHVAAVLIPFLIDLRREHPMNNPVVDAQTHLGRGGRRA